MPRGWEGIRSGFALAMRHRLQWFIHLRAHGLRKGDEHPACTSPRGVWHPLPFYSQCIRRHAALSSPQTFRDILCHRRDSETAVKKRIDKIAEDFRDTLYLVERCSPVNLSKTINYQTAQMTIENVSEIQRRNATIRGPRHFLNAASNSL